MKLFNKITLLSIGAAMAIGGGVAACLIPNKSANAVSGNFAEYKGSVAEGDYVIYDNGSALKASLTKNRFDNAAVSSNGTIENPDDDLLWHLAPLDGTDYWTLFNSSTGKYLGSTATKNTGALLDEVTDFAKWTVSKETDYFEFINLGRSTASSDANNKFLRHNGNSGWASYATGTGGKPKLYKKSSSDPNTLTGVSVSTTFITVKLNSTITVTSTPIPSTAIEVEYGWESTDTTVATVADGTITGKALGSTTITASACQPDGADVTYTANLKVVVTEHAGTAEDPFNVDDAIRVAEATGTTATEKYYVTGEIDGSVTYNNSNYAGFYLGSLQCYQIRDIGNVAFTDKTKLADTYTVVVKSQIINYNGTTPELQYGELISVENNKTLSSVEIRGNVTASVSVGDDFILTELKVYAVYSDNTEEDVTQYATLTSNPAKAETAGTTRITVSASYNDVDAEARQFDVTVEAAQTLVSDEIAITDLGITGSYTAVSGVKVSTNALYSAYVAKSGTNIQTNSKNGYGFVSTRTGGRRIKSVSFTYGQDNGKYMDVYASNTPYTFNNDTANELYSESTQGTFQGGVSGTGTVTFVGDYRYVGIRARSGAAYIASITITYEAYTAATLAEDFKVMAGDSWSNHVSTATCNSKYATAKELLLTLSSAELETFKTSTDTEIAAARAAYENWCDRNADENPYAGDIVTSSRGIAINNTSSIVIVMVAIASITLVGAAMMLKKRKFSK